ncbi:MULTISPECIES: hypothetical protein [Weeksellaceae]|uniref:Uncharacterized protein n=1 Tax=Riemerella anatipestifer TaxID=34085 RepID=A0AAP6LJF3_RIEAN|nr:MULTISPECIES: hypothetical protein [Weeksellaceae]MCO7354050.1 hypothetical protein [Riemerella anatipestifer]MCU7559119.1 hypothetical protein [Riemerella anatipestifer]MCU7571150.1 hypothetical protein [Riemerella anatipestifer]MCU7597573.1 hypothetical protein [Riemerella anatipestifer]MCW0494222.1 hypothetical protein [Riemerella anatipestifer]
MTKTFKKIIRFEDATAFKLEYWIGGSELKSKEFNSYKSMEQFHNRQTDFLYLDCHRFAFVNGEWHRFIKLNSPFVFEDDIDFINKKFYEIVEENNLQKYKIED